MNRKKEKALVVAPRIWKSSKNYHNSIEEISLLISTLGIQVKKVIEQKINNINPAYFIGSGKAKQVIEQAKMLGVNYIIFDEDLSPVQNAVNDANAIADLLRQDYGFKVDTLIDASREETLKALSKIRKQASKKDNVLIYYAGHGWRHDDSEDGFWLPIDSSMDSEVNWIPNTDVIRTVKKMKAKHVMVIADSCFSGTFTRGVNVVKKDSNFLEKILR